MDQCLSHQIWDFPGQIDFFDPAFDSEHIFGGCGALIFVIDAQVCFQVLLCTSHECRPFRMIIVKR